MRDLSREEKITSAKKKLKEYQQLRNAKLVQADKKSVELVKDDSVPIISSESEIGPSCDFSNTLSSSFFSTPTSGAELRSYFAPASSDERDIFSELTKPMEADSVSCFPAPSSANKNIFIAKQLVTVPSSFPSTNLCQNAVEADGTFSEDQQMAVESCQIDSLHLSQALPWNGPLSTRYRYVSENSSSPSSDEFSPRFEHKIRRDENFSSLLSARRISKIKKKLEDEKFELQIELEKMRENEKLQTEALKMMAEEKSKQQEQTERQTKELQTIIKDMQAKLDESNLTNEITVRKQTEILQKRFELLQEKEKELDEEKEQLERRLRLESERNEQARQRIEQLETNVRMYRLKFQQLGMGMEMGRVASAAEHEDDEEDGGGSSNHSADDFLMVKKKEDEEKTEKLIGELQTRIQTLIYERQQMEDNFRQFVDNLKQRVDDAENEKQTLLLKINGQTEHLIILEKQLQRQMVQLEQRQENEDTEKIGSLNQELYALKDQMRQMELTNGDLQSRVENEKSLREGLERELEKLKLEMCSLVELEKGLESEKVAASQAILQNNKLKEQLYVYTESVKSLEEEKTSLTQQLELAKEELRRLQQDKNSTNNESNLLTTEESIASLEPRNGPRRLVNEGRAKSSERMRVDSESTFSLSTSSSVIPDLVNPIDDFDLELDLDHQLQLQHIASPNSCSAKEVTCESGSELEAMMQLQEKFKHVVERMADLTEEKQQLEHLVMQLQSETETIEEYVTLYQKQKSLLQKQARETAIKMETMNKERIKFLSLLRSISQMLTQSPTVERIITQDGDLEEQKAVIELTNVISIALGSDDWIHQSTVTPVSERTQAQEQHQQQLEHHSTIHLPSCGCCSGNVITI